MNTFSNRMQASLILTTGWIGLFLVLVVLFGDPIILRSVGLTKTALILVTGSFGISVSMTGYLSFLDQSRSVQLSSVGRGSNTIPEELGE